MHTAPATLEAFVQRYDDKIRRFLQCVTTLSPPDLDDVTQDVYVRFAKNSLLERYAPDRGAQFETYVFWVCSSVARNRHRARTRQPQFVPIDRDLVPQDWDSFDIPATKAEARRIPKIGATQEQQTFAREIRDRLAAVCPGMRPAIDRFEQTGQIELEHLLTLQGALAGFR